MDAKSFIQLCLVFFQSQEISDMLSSSGDIATLRMHSADCLLPAEEE